MAQLTPDLVAEIVRQRLGEPDSSRAARYMFLIPDALKATGRKIAASPFLRQMMMTDPAETTADLDENGRIDLTALYESHHILHEYIDYGLIFLENENYPLQKISLDRARLNQRLASSYRFYYIEGDRLCVKDETGGTVSFAVPKYPASLADLPASEEIQKLFIDKLIELVAGQDFAEDGEK